MRACGIPAGLNNGTLESSTRAAASNGPPQAAARVATEGLSIVLGSGADRVVAPGLPVLAGERTERWFPGAQPSSVEGELRLYRWGEWILGSITVPVGPSIEVATLAAYRAVLQATREYSLARIWNYVPAINAPGLGGVENYRLFSRGRSIAFEEAFGENFKARLPAASAVGCDSGALTVVFTATMAKLRHVESPLQVPAYDYPSEHGPRAPSFARATVVTGSDGATVFISGTAAIRGHATVAPDQLSGQLDCALENLAAISARCELGHDLGREGSMRRAFKVYLRNPADVPVIRARLERDLLRPTDFVSYVRSDVCRSALLVEVEATIMPA